MIEGLSHMGLRHAGLSESGWKEVERLQSIRLLTKLGGGGGYEKYSHV